MNIEMKTNRLRFLQAALAVMVLAQAAAAEETGRFAKEIEAFAAADKTNAPPQHAILFIGSSSIRGWTNLARDFPGRQVINRGFGGSVISDSVHYFDRIVAPYHPRLIVFYAGSNDINGGKRPESVLEDFKAFARKVRETLPETRLDYVSICPSPSRWHEVEEVKEANRLIREFIGRNEKMGYIDIFAAMLGPDGKPNADLFVSDRLHPNARGYAIWKTNIAPYLQ
jgi:lysophospholipase L1-like esterase